MTSTAAEILEQARAFERGGRLREAEQLCRGLLQADASNADALYLLGIVYERSNQLGEAAATFERVVQIKPDHDGAYNRLGNVYCAQGRFGDAISNYQQALRLRPALADYQRNLETAEAARCIQQGAAMLEQGRHDEAVACYRRVVALRPTDCQAHAQLGNALGQQGKLDEAIGCYRKAIELRPDFADGYFNLSMALGMQDRFDEAIAALRRVVELQPNLAQAHYNLGLALVHCNRPEEAIASFRQAVQLKPDFSAAHCSLGLALVKSNQVDDGIACYRRALEWKPDFAEAHGHLAGALAQLDRLDEAVASYRSYLALKPDHAEGYCNLTIALARQRKFDEAAACCRRALALEPDNATAHNNLGSILAKQDKLDDAVVSYRRALALQPDFPEAATNLGTVLIQQGRIDEAAVCYQAAADFHPEQPIWRLDLISLCPSVFDDSGAMVAHRERLLTRLAEFAKTEPPLDLAELLDAQCGPSFSLQFHGLDDRPIREAYAKIFSKQFPVASASGSSGRPRIGFVVTERHESIFLKSMKGVLARLNPELFDVMIATTAHGIALFTSGIRNPAIQYIELPRKFSAMVETIARAQFDLLYHWEIGTDNKNYFLPYHRLAPAQCTSWGIQVTSGIPQVDYYLSSALAEPEGAEDYYSEKLILAGTLLTYQFRVKKPDPIKPRERFGIAADQHAYLCGQRLGKIHPEFDPILGGILRRDARGVVVLIEDEFGQAVAEQLRRRFARTISDVAGRIRFLPFQHGPDYLNLTLAADVLLDPLHFGGVNSTYDAFSLNKAMVTLPTRFQRGRYTLGCYKKMGITDCVASSPEHYIDIAIALGTDAEYRRAVEERIQQASDVLFEDPEAVTEHERIFSEIIAASREGRQIDRS